jgi:hypothetical protein
MLYLCAVKDAFSNRIVGLSALHPFFVRAPNRLDL